MIAVVTVCMLILNVSTVCANDSLRIAVVDWTQAETLVALDVTPVGVAQKSDYHAWVRFPSIPESTKDIGLRTQPNVERLLELEPDKILISPMFAALEGKLSHIAPVLNVGLYRNGRVDWPAITAYTKKIAREVDRDAASRVLISEAENTFDTLRASLSMLSPPLLVVQFMDSKHVRVFGDNSLYKVAMNEIGLKNGWEGSTNAWGFNLIGIDQLLGVNAQIVVVEPLPQGVERQLNNDAFWQYVIMQSGYPLLNVEPTWSFGAVPSAVRFATLISEALIEENSLALAEERTVQSSRNSKINTQKRGGAQ
ncbi:ABC transporter substrate-binding protein [Enterovibrio calviensis]|uniref:ABC transporter substrate-binding protein n=1 Tax=Enterovibrio calviensis TaxID=91359 RepID=UPI0037367514